MSRELSGIRNFGELVGYVNLVDRQTDRQTGGGREGGWMGEKEGGRERYLW